MVRLRRTVRFAINADAPGGTAGNGPSYNSYAAHPSPIGLARYFEIEATCRGEPDAGTGYVINIKDIDEAVRRSAVPLLAAACEMGGSAADSGATGGFGSVPALLPEIHRRVQALLPVACSGLTLRLTPHHSLEVQTEMDTTSTPTTVLVRTAFDLAAAHRLNCAALSPEENRAIFGKCNNPSGHGHNYRVEPCVALDLAAAGASTFTIQMLERITDRTIIARFDHKHLNLDTPEFADAGGVNPSVENIAKVFFGLLAPAIRAASDAATLRSITVWETDRTCATYPG